MNLIHKLSGLFLSKVRVHFERDHRVSNLRDVVIGRLHELVHMDVVEGGQYEVKVLFCPIVSRAGTDIEAVLSRAEADEPTIVIVLHHTLNSRAIIPSSSVYDRKGLILVDLLFSEDQGLLECPKNHEAFTRAARYLNQYTPATGWKNVWPVLPLIFWVWLDYRHYNFYYTIVGIMGFVGGYLWRGK